MSGPASSRGRRRWLVRLALALGAPAVFFLALEGGLRVAGFGRPTAFLIPDEIPGYFRTNPAFCGRFMPGSFDLRPLNFRVARSKPPNTLRIVVLGESAAQGVPVPSFAFAAQLRAQLRAHYPGKQIEVIDTGIVAINSHVIYQIAGELAGFEPDLYLVYAGNNEVVGPYGPGCAYLSQMPPLWAIRASVWVRSTRTGQWLGALLGRLASAGRPKAEWGGMSMFVNQAVPGNDARLAAVYDNFSANLRGIVQAAAGAGAKTILCTVVGNLKDCPPLLSRHRSDLSASELVEWQAAADEGGLAWRLGDVDRARRRLGQARRIDPEYADTSFMLGSLDWQSGAVESARRHFFDALHWDALRFRPDPRINQVVREVARGGFRGVSLLDAAVALGADPASVGPPAGRELLFEHVHFDWDGNYRLARMMAQSCAAAISGDAGSDGNWLDSAACAEALAYTPHERLPMLLRIDVLVRKPPFSNQLTYVADEARMSRDIAAATLQARTPATLDHAATVAEHALARDPDNPVLAGVGEGIALDRGDVLGALGLARRAARLLPRDFAQAADEASILMQLGRFDEAEKALLPWTDSAADRDLLAPLFARLWTESGHGGDGSRLLDRWIGQNPADGRLRIIRAELRRAAGDGAGAEGEFRAILAADPANEDALEGLIAQLEASGRSDAAAQESLTAAPHQPGNQPNDLRAAKLLEARGDPGGAITWLMAAERCGPVNATFELTLALKLYQLNRRSEMLTHLALAWTLAREEGHPDVTESIGRLIERMR